MSACVTANSCASSTEVRLTFVPETDAERRVRARELRAEARAWRRAAERYDRDPSWHCYTPYGAFSQYVWESRLGRRVEYLGYARHVDHVGAAGGYALTLHGDPKAVVLACLFLALECEDEARALGRGGQ